MRRRKKKKKEEEEEKEEEKEEVDPGPLFPWDRFLAATGLAFCEPRGPRLTVVSDPPTR